MNRLKRFFRDLMLPYSMRIYIAKYRFNQRRQRWHAQLGIRSFTLKSKRTGETMGLRDTHRRLTILLFESPYALASDFEIVFVPSDIEVWPYIKRKLPQDGPTWMFVTIMFIMAFGIWSFVYAGLYHPESIGLK